MASIERRGQTFRIVFRFRGIKYARALNARSENGAEIARLQLEEKLSRINSGALVPTPGIDLVDFLLGPDGRPSTASVANAKSPPAPRDTERGSIIRCTECIHYEPGKRAIAKSARQSGHSHLFVPGRIAHSRWVYRSRKGSHNRT
jgi:hypothetical protein